MIKRARAPRGWPFNFECHLNGPGFYRYHNHKSADFILTLLNELLQIREREKGEIRKYNKKISNIIDRARF